MVLRDDAMFVPCETSMGNVGNAALVEHSNNQKFALSTKILATVKTDWPL